MIGLGSGVTAGSALAHEGTRVDAVEISPEVVEAARLFSHVNRSALDDPRLRVVVDDGRNHLLLDRPALRRGHLRAVEPLDGGRERAVHARLLRRWPASGWPPGGLFCQWAHIYNMAPDDLRTVVGGFTDVFPGAALFLRQRGRRAAAGRQRATCRGRIRRRCARAWARRPCATTWPACRCRPPFGLASLFAAGPSRPRAPGRRAPRATPTTGRCSSSAPRARCTPTPAARTGRRSSAPRAAASAPEPYRLAHARRRPRRSWWSARACSRRPTASGWPWPPSAAPPRSIRRHLRRARGHRAHGAASPARAREAEAELKALARAGRR